MGSGHRLTDTIRNPAHHDITTTCGSYHIHLVTTIKHGLHQRERQGNLLLSPSVNTDATRSVINAYHLEISGIYTNLLTTGVTTTLEEILIHLFTDDAYLTMFTDVHIVEVASVVYLRFNDINQLRNGTLDSGCSSLVAIVGGIPTSPRREDDRYHIFEFRHTLLQSLHILIVHAPPATFTKTFIGFGSLLGPNDDSVLSKAFEVLVEHLLHGLTTTHEAYKHEHSPKHAETCQERARLVSCQRVEDFSICINIYSHNTNLLLAPQWGGFYLPYMQGSVLRWFLQ